MTKTKFIILNKKNFSKDKIERPQCFVMGKPQKAGNIIELDLDDERELDAANNLIFTKFGEPADKAAKEEYENKFKRKPITGHANY